MLSFETLILEGDGQGKTEPVPFSSVMQDILPYVVYGGIFLVLFIPLIVTNGMAFPDVTGKNYTFRIIIEIIFAAWLLLALYDVKYRPKFSWITGTFGIFLTAVFLADVFGVDPIKSLLGNYERMEGFVAIIHIFMYFVVLSSILRTEKKWQVLFNTSLAVAAIVSLLAVREINQDVGRIGGTLGKSTFLAIYMLFHIFISFLMLTRAKSGWTKFLYSTLVVLFVFTLIHTVTRGTVIGLMGGLFITSLYVSIFGHKHKTLQKIAVVGFVSIILLTVSFVSLRNTDFIQEKPILSRIASISLDAGETRFTLWGIAYEGFMERPVLGWGQENYNYIFDKYYEPSLHSQEQWFDRSHNIFLEWLVASGVVGLATYLALILTSVYYLLIRPLRKKDDDVFTPTERGILLGLLSGYLIHNFFVFDEIVSYIFFVTILSFVHVRITNSASHTKSIIIPERTVNFLITPVVIILFFLIFFVNVPGIKSSTDFAHAHTIFSSAKNDSSYLQAIELFNSSLTRQRYADQEILEQLSRLAPSFYVDKTISSSTKNAFTSVTEDAFLKQIDDRPNDAKLRAFAGLFYSSLGDDSKSLEQYQIAREISPKKQPILFSIGFIYIKNNKFEEAKAIFKEAYEYAPEFAKARNLYAVSAIYDNDWDLFSELIDTEHEELFLQSEFGVKVLYSTGNLKRLESMLIRHAEKTNDLQMRIILATVQSELGNKVDAIQTTKETIRLFPEFEPQGTKIIESLLD